MYFKSKFPGIVPFMATPLKGRFIVFLKWLLIGYFRLYWVRWLPRMVRQLALQDKSPPQGLEIGEKLLWKYKESPLKGRCHEKDYTQISFWINRLLWVLKNMYYDVYNNVVLKRNRFIFAELEPDFNHIEKLCIGSYYRQFSTYIKIKLINLKPIFLAQATRG